MRCQTFQKTIFPGKDGSNRKNKVYERQQDDDVRESSSHWLAIVPHGILHPFPNHHDFVELLMLTTFQLFHGNSLEGFGSYEQNQVHVTVADMTPNAHYDLVARGEMGV